MALWGLHPHVFGFIHGVSMLDRLITLLAHTNNRPTVTVFFDPEKALEPESPHAILIARVREGVRRRLLAWLQDFL